MGLLVLAMVASTAIACGGGGDRASIPENLPLSDMLIERAGPARQEVPRDPERDAFFGDLHVHTSLSADAFNFGTTITPRDAYRYAQGGAILHPAGFTMQLREPLDFYAVTDHAMFLGVPRAAADTRTEFSKLAFAQSMHGLNDDPSTGLLDILMRVRAFTRFSDPLFAALTDGSLDIGVVEDVMQSAWLETIEAADAANAPGDFTTFVAYEYTPNIDGGSLHRNVIFEDSARLPIQPFSRLNSVDPEDMWTWLDALRARGVEALAIPHNSNLSNGQMFALEDLSGEPIDAEYAERRARNEPLIEITQVKGTSETHPNLSDTDEWAAFEIAYESGANATTSMDNLAGSYVRQAMRDGLLFAEKGIPNPFAFGVVAASDTHVGATTDDEANFYGKVGLVDARPDVRGIRPLPWYQALVAGWVAPGFVAEVDGRTYVNVSVRRFGASGLAAVWAESNTREDIYAAFRRKETFGTSGPRIRVRFFAGATLDVAMLEDPGGIASAYERGVPMGGDLELSDGEVPRFLAFALRDPNGTPLQRLQVVKGWVEAGRTREAVFDIACSQGALPSGDTHRCPDNGAKVDLTNCAISADGGADTLQAVWTDPNFDPSQRAFYYLRAIENPTCRWSTWDAIRAGLPLRSDLPATLQERAWSSPIHYAPAS
ncbi:MAG: DUF3604 domain-containing protein [Myxococcota bacterium]|nr:DUF3604 domain-containing protein [Myxococcota bacterium]